MGFWDLGLGPGFGLRFTHGRQLGLGHCSLRDNFGSPQLVHAEGHVTGGSGLTASFMSGLRSLHR